MLLSTWVYPFFVGQDFSLSSRKIQVMRGVWQYAPTGFLIRVTEPSGLGRGLQIPNVGVRFIEPKLFFFVGLETNKEQPPPNKRRAKSCREIPPEARYHTSILLKILNF